MPFSRFRFHRKAKDAESTQTTLPVQDLGTIQVADAPRSRQPIQLDCGSDIISSVIFVEQQNLIITASHDNCVLLYNLDTSGSPYGFFGGHDGEIAGLAQLDSDLVASVSMADSLLLTWRVSDTKQIDSWQHSAPLTAVTKLDDCHIIVGDWSGGVVIVKHENGTSLHSVKNLTNSPLCSITCIEVHRNVFVTCSQKAWKSQEPPRAYVWDAHSFKQLAILNRTHTVRCTAVNEARIITTDANHLYVYENAPQFQRLQKFRIPRPIHHIQFLNEDILAAASIGGIMFISLSQESIHARRPLCKHLLTSLVLLPDTRIAVGGHGGFACLLSPPAIVFDLIRTCVSRLYPSSNTLIVFPPLLRDAWNDVQSDNFSLKNACTTLITSQNCSSSLDEWCFAHNLLMEAVNSRQIDPSCDFNGKQLHWHQVLYTHCSKLAIGEKDIDYLLSLFRQAEVAGVIDKGAATVFIDVTCVRKDIVKDTRYISSAIYQLFLRQAQTDIRLQKVLHYQRVQQLTAVINAIVGCIPIAGGIATNVLSGGASILNDFQICGLVESLMGTGKDLIALGTDHLVDRFVTRGSQVLTGKQWLGLSDEQRKVVKDAASNLGLTVEELRERLHTVLNMQQSIHEFEAHETNITIEEVESYEPAKGENKSTPVSGDSDKPRTTTDQRAAKSVPSSGTSEVGDLTARLRALQELELDKTKASTQYMHIVKKTKQHDGEAESFSRTNDFAARLRGLEEFESDKTDILNGSTVVTEKPIILRNQHTVESVSCSATIEKEDLATQLRTLQKAGLSKATVQDMDSMQVANTLSAFLVMYKIANAKRFDQMREVVGNQFVTKSICGLTFTESNEAIQKIVFKVTLNALSQVVDQDELQLLSIILRKFLQLLC